MIRVNGINAGIVVSLAILIEKQFRLEIREKVGLLQPPIPILMGSLNINP
jgi:hypothetical protein